MEIREHTYQATKTEGKIVKLHPNGWGFILSPQLQFTRIFFHWTALSQNTLNFTDLKVGMRVRFYTQHHKEQGVRAYRIEVMDITPNLNSLDDDYGNKIHSS